MAIRCLLFLAFLMFLVGEHVHAQPTNLYSSANLSTLWINGLFDPYYCSNFNIIMLLELPTDDTTVNSVAFGFFCNNGVAGSTDRCDSFYLSIFIQQQNNSDRFPHYNFCSNHELVWTANRDHPVRVNSTLNLSHDGNLVLRDADGSTVWSTDTAGRSVAGMKLTGKGSLILFDLHGLPVWDSFDHPTDTWLLGQTLTGMGKCWGRYTPNRKHKPVITASVSPANWTTGQFFISIDAPGYLNAYVRSNPPQLYYQLIMYQGRPNNSLNKSFSVIFTNGSLHASSGLAYGFNLQPSPSTFQFMRLEFDGHLRHYELQHGVRNLLQDVLNLDPCSYPTVCGEYGVCYNGYCSCPNATYFRPTNEAQNNLGCSPITPLSCQSTQSHRLIALEDYIFYFNYMDEGAAVINNTGVKACKEACLRNCSCKAAFLRSEGAFPGIGSCYLPSQVFSMLKKDSITTRDPLIYEDSVAYLKVQISDTQNGEGNVNAVVLASVVGSSLTVLLIICVIIVLLRNRKNSGKDEEDNFDLVSGLPKRYSFEELKVATQDFSQKLGGGGFGSVYRGTMNDGIEVAVKRLEGVGQGKKEFLAEIMTLGSIHHLNLASLIGFCADKSHRLLVYDYMCNGSLDKWIFGRNHDKALGWQLRRKILTDIAKGLAYLHEECKQKIAHFDIKPQNILLDEDFTAKVSDFGLAKLIDRDESQVITRMRGTHGYLAPEWLSSKITEKADIYSFGVVVIETLCGRKNLDFSQPEYNVHLLALLKEKAETNCLVDIVDSHISDFHVHETEIIQMMKLAMWCLQNDSNKRPPMSIVLKVLEGSIDVEPNLDYNFTSSTSMISRDADALRASPLPSASLLSGPR